MSTEPTILGMSISEIERKFRELSNGTKIDASAIDQFLKEINDEKPAKDLCVTLAIRLSFLPIRVYRDYGPKAFLRVRDHLDEWGKLESEHLSMSLP